MDVGSAMLKTLTDPQQKAADKALSTDSGGVLIKAETGAGKTLVAAHVALKKAGGGQIIVIGPAGDKIFSQWGSEFRSLDPNVHFVKVDGSPDGKRAREDMLSGRPGVFYLSNAYSRMATTNKFIKDEHGEKVQVRHAQWMWDEVRPAVMIVDESHVMSNRDGLDFKSLLKVRPSVFRIAISATASGSRFDGIWATSRFLWPHVPGRVTLDNPSGLLVDKSKNRWMVVWCSLSQDRFSPRGWVPTGEKTPGAWLGVLPCVLEWEGVPKQNPTPEIHRVVLHPGQRAQFDRMQEDALIWADDNPLVAELPVSKWARLRQISLGEITVDDQGVVDFVPGGESAKADMVVSLINEDPTQTWVVYLESQRFIKVLIDRLGPQAVEWSGKVPKAKRPGIMEDFGPGPGHKYRVLVATYGAIAVGTDGLQMKCSNELWVEEPSKNLVATQVEGRLDRWGQTGTVRRVKIMADKTLDDGYTQRKIAERRALKRSGVA